MRLKVFLILAGWTLFWFSLVAWVEGKESGPSVKLHIFPRSQMAPFNRPAPVTLRVVILNANEELWCPGRKWVFSEGNTSSQEPDCDPFDEMDPEDTERQSWTVRHGYYRGEWEPCVILFKSGETIRKVCARVSVK